MSIMVTELYDALVDAGASEEKTRAAARAMADYETSFNTIDSELKVDRWMLTLLVALNTTILFKLFS